MILHGYFRSTASWRVRICLHLKQIAFEHRAHHLRKGEHRAPSFLALNPQGLVPALEVDGQIITQSLAICEYLDERYPLPPILPVDPLKRARVRALAQIVACDIHPVQNLKVLNRVTALSSEDEAAQEWARQTISEGLAAFDAARLAWGGGTFSLGNAVTLADLCLVPQLGNARRFGVAIPPELEAIEKRCLEHESFQQAQPDHQPDFERL